MYKLCKTEQSAQRQRELEHGLLELMLLKNYEDISISELCDYLQIPRKSFYRYFSSKDGAFYALLDHTMQECIAFTPGEDNRLQAFEYYFTFWLSKKPLLDALERSGLSGKLVERAVADCLNDQVLTSHLRRAFPALRQDSVVLFFVSGLMSLVIQWHHEGCRETPVQMARIVTQLVTEPLF